MNQKEKTAIKAGISKLFDKWTYLITNRGYRVKINYFDTNLDSEGILREESAMACKSQWRYQESTIAVNLLECATLPEGELEWTVVHELVHILMGEGAFDDISIMERTCSELTSAILETARLDTSAK